ncbi:MAG TPA: hypothetical protein VFN77_06375 [Acetobacteraceae bacterium]|nr:hypothetical protein [Acetobacteraceae bacterium]
MPDSQTAALPPEAVNAVNVLRRFLLRQWALLLSMPLLLWPALYNGFPLVFSDTGTYISQLIERHLGWDRPPFYSLFLLLLGWGKSLWPPVMVQAIFTAWLITRVRRTIIPQMGAAYDFGIIGILAIATALPWATGEIMPDLFTPLMVLGLFLLAFDPNLQKAENALLILTLAGMMTFHLTNLPIYFGLCLTVLALARWIGMMMPWRLIMAAPVLSILALGAVNLIGTGIPSISPYGATFYLARLLADGPARETLAQDCPHEDWALCHYQKEIPDSADAFLWMNSSPLYRAGGPKRLIVQTKKIIRLTLAEHPASAFDGPVARCVEILGGVISGFIQPRESALARRWRLHHGEA